MPPQGTQGPQANSVLLTLLTAGLAPDTVQRLIVLRRRSEKDQDGFIEHELAHLRFLRGLYEAEKLSA